MKADEICAALRAKQDRHATEAANLIEDLLDRLGDLETEVTRLKKEAAVRNELLGQQTVSRQITKQR